MLASMRLCANTPGQLAIQTALGGYQSIDDLVAPGGRLRRQRDLALRAADRDSRRQLRQAEGGAVPVPEARPEALPDRGRPAVRLRAAGRAEGADRAGHRLQLAAARSLPHRLPAELGRPGARPSAASPRFLDHYRTRHSREREPSRPASSMKPIQVGLLGTGIVGAGTFIVLQPQPGRDPPPRRPRASASRIVADLDTARASAVAGGGAEVTDDARAVIARPGDRHRRRADRRLRHRQGRWCSRPSPPASTWSRRTRRCSRCTAPRSSPRRATRASIVAFEAAVAGGIPIIKALREGPHRQPHRVDRRHHQRHDQLHPLGDARQAASTSRSALAEAQRLGYAEADPSFDIEGIDAAHKATLMRAIAFGVPVQFAKAYVEGITQLKAADIAYAEQLGYRIKLLGITKRRDAEAAPGGIELRVHPTLVPAKRLIANVEGAMNAVLVQGDAVGTTLYYGKGAGAEPTASAVIADLVDMARLDTRRPRPPRAASRLPAGGDAGPADPAHRRGRHRVLPAPAGGRRGRRAGAGHRHPGRARHLDRRAAAAPGRNRRARRRGAHRRHHPHARHRRRPHDEGDRGDAGAADGARADRAHPQGRPGVEIPQHARRGERPRLQRHPARGPRARRRPLPARALPARRRGDARALARPVVCRAGVRDPLALRRRHPGRRPARISPRRPTPPKSSAPPRIVPLRRWSRASSCSKPVQRPDAGLQGHGDAAPRQPVRVRAGAARRARSTSSAPPRATPAAPPNTPCGASTASTSSCCRRTAA